MAVYKVIQDIEAEDKLLGPLTLKGFIYAAISGILAFICVRLGISGASPVLKTILIVLALPPMVLFGVLASPLGGQQPTEVWLLARIRYMFKNHERHWDQSGIKQLVTVTVPKKVAQQLTKNFSKDEVNSRLSALANMLDSRGWTVNNQAVNINSQDIVAEVAENDERLAAASAPTQIQPIVDITDADDIMDEQNNEAAKKIQQQMQEAEEQRKAQLRMQLEAERQRALVEAERMKAQQNINPETESDEEKALLDQIHARQDELKRNAPKIIKGATRQPVTEQTSSVKMELANSGNALSVATISLLANKQASADAVVGPL